MSTSGRRFEILLPLRFNDGSPVPDDFIADALVELRGKFGAVSAETQRIEGQWQHAGQVYRDELIRVENNPAKAGLVLDPKTWPWSSARFGMSMEC